MPDYFVFPISRPFTVSYRLLSVPLLPRLLSLAYTPSDFFTAAASIISVIPCPLCPNGKSKSPSHGWSVKNVFLQRGGWVTENYQVNRYNRRQILNSVQT